MFPLLKKGPHSIFDGPPLCITAISSSNTTLFLPVSFARYRELSVLLKIFSWLSSSCHCVTPKLEVILPTLSNSCLSISSRSFSATIRAFSRSVCGHRIRNSSPPHLHIVSDILRFLVRMSAISLST